MNRASRIVLWILAGVAMTAAALTLIGIGCRVLIIYIINSAKP